MRTMLYASLFGLVFVLAGCSESGPPKRVVKGKITSGNDVIPVKIDPVSKAGERLRVWLKDAKSDKVSDAYHAQINVDDGTFTIAGGDGRGVPAGTYKVCIEWNDTFNKDKFNGRFSEANTPIVRDMPPPDDMLIIDVSKPKG